MKPPIDASRFGSAAAAYQATLPGVRCEHANGQIELLDVTIDTSAIANEPRLVAAAELVELGQLQLGLPGVLPTRTPWVRGMRDKVVPWEQLQLRLNGIDKHRGRKWTQHDEETMALVRAQTWNAADIGQKPLTIPEWLDAGDAIVSPINGRLVQLPRNPGERRMLEVLWAAYEAGTGGVYMSKVDWATKLRCSVRSVYNYQRGLERKGLGEFQQLWAPLPDGKAGSRRGYVLARIGRGIFDTAWAEPFARRQPAAVDVTKELATRLGVELRERARLRAYHVSGQLYRLKRWGDPQPQKRRNRPGTSIAFNRQTLPDSPSHGGLLQSAPPDGGRGRREEDAPCSGPVARAGAPSSARACTSDGPRERNTGERRGSGAIANPMPLLRRDAIELAPSERFGALLYELLGQDGGDAS
jgi:hypothetical protein